MFLWKVPVEAELCYLEGPVVECLLERLYAGTVVSGRYIVERV